MNGLLSTTIILAAGLSFAVQAQNICLVHPLGSDEGNACIETPCRTIGRAIQNHFEE